MSNGAEEQQQAMRSCDGQDLKALVQAGLAWLEQNYEFVNTQNVFPVPDGDTGTNMLMTMRSAWNEIANSDERHAGRIAAGIYNGALMGARGNSGVILSQLWAGFSRSVEARPVIDVSAFAAALQEASQTAYRAVQRPVEGTMLTVAREASAVALEAAQQVDTLLDLLEQVVAECHESVQRTPDLLPVLKDAGVVDSGGMGYTFVIEGMLRFLRGDSLELSGPSTSGVPERLANDAWLVADDEEGWGYDIQYLIKGFELDVNQIRADIEAMGDSALVVGSETVVKVHVHVHDPGVPLSYGAALGALDDIVVENMQAQAESFGTTRNPGTVAKPIEVLEGQIGVITVSPSPELTNIFYSLGAGHVIAGGQTMNPSTQDFVEAIESLPTDRYVILPNNGNILMAANQAAQLVSGNGSGTQVSVVPSRTIPQGISALLSLDPEGDLEHMTSEMTDAMSQVITGEVTTATRDVTLNGIEVREGQIIGLVDGKIVLNGDDVSTVVIALLEKMQAHEHELITLYSGENQPFGQAETLAEHLQEEFPHLEIELQEGGQPHYYYIISVE
ncbi:MAG: DAK2 domain-containing protein [Chloroflexi bacterium]|nr:DAK2 domain-containing protein [Chloroflexota bacterium]